MWTVAHGTIHVCLASSCGSPLLVRMRTSPCSLPKHEADRLCQRSQPGMASCCFDFFSHCCHKESVRRDMRGALEGCRKSTPCSTLSDGPFAEHVMLATLCAHAYARLASQAIHDLRSAHSIRCNVRLLGSPPCALKLTYRDVITRVVS